MSDFPKVQGFCLMGCGPTLFLGEGGYVTCSWIECPRPDAVSDLFARYSPVMTDHLADAMRGGTFS